MGENGDDKEISVKIVWNPDTQEPTYQVKGCNGTMLLMLLEAVKIDAVQQRHICMALETQKQLHVEFQRAALSAKLAQGR